MVRKYFKTKVKCRLNMVVIFSTLLLFNSACAQYHDLSKIDAKALHLKAIRNYQNTSPAEHHYFDISGNLTESKFYQSFYTKRLFEYNNFSQVIKILELDDDDCILDEMHVSYNKKKLAICSTLYDEKGVIIYRDSTHFTRDRKEQEFTRFSKSGKIKFGFQFYYDKKGRLTTKKEYNSKKQLDYTTKYFYSATNKIEKEIIIDAAGKEDIRWETIYDPSGNEIKTICSGDCITGGWQKKYDENCQVTEYIEFTKQGMPFRIYNYKYDLNGNKTETKLEEAGVVSEKQQLFYNDKNLLIKKITSDQEVYSATYEFYD